MSPLISPKVAVGLENTIYSTISTLKTHVNKRRDKSEIDRVGVNERRDKSEMERVVNR